MLYGQQRTDVLLVLNEGPLQRRPSTSPAFASHHGLLYRLPGSPADVYQEHSIDNNSILMKLKTTKHFELKSACVVKGYQN
jgi:hypothetical protein